MSKPSRSANPEDEYRVGRTFFVTGSTAGGRRILQTERMANLFIEVLRTKMRDGKFVVHDFVVMPNNFHLLLTVSPASTIERVMQLIKGGFSFRARKELSFHGEVWLRGYSDEQVRDERSFNAHRSYIEMNPVRAGLCASPDEFEYGSLFLKRRKLAGAKAHLQESHVGTTKVVP